MNCGREIQPSSQSCRNHCPYCLHSVHLDVFPGDRAADCGGLMVPMEVIYHTKKGYQVIHRCQKCGVETKNILSLDDPVQPDSLEAVMEIMKKKS